MNWKEAIATLPELEGDIVRRFVTRRQDLRTVARELGISPTKVMDLRTVAFDLLYPRAEEIENFRELAARMKCLGRLEPAFTAVPQDEYERAHKRLKRLWGADRDFPHNAIMVEVLRNREVERVLSLDDAMLHALEQGRETQDEPAELDPERDFALGGSAWHKFCDADDCDGAA